MKTTTYRFTVLASIALASALLLGACGSQKASTVQTSSSSSKTVQSSSSSSKKAVKKTKASSSSSTAQDNSVASSSSETSPSSSASAPVASSQATQATTPKQGQATASTQENQSESNSSSSLDINSLSQGDFSSIAGTWQNDQGSVVTINADGKMSDGSFLYPNTAEGNIYIASLGTKEGFGAGVWIAPAGQEFPESLAPKEFTAGTDISKERLVIGQSADTMAHPYYRVN